MSQILTFKAMITDELYMSRCIQLAKNGIRDVAPNPMVGAVIVCDGKIIGEGYHQKCGQPHAEPNAIASVTDQQLLSRSTLYVSLEPCSHYGKTPPCAELIIKKRIPRVVIGMKDPNPQVAGNGIRMLTQAGIDVTVGILEQQCRWLNRRFICYHEKKRPYIILKWAQTADFKIDACRQSSSESVAVISNTITKQLVHQMRAENMAIMVGTRTAVLDNPSLRTTRWSGNNPLRVVIDKQLKLPQESKLLQPIAPTLVFTEKSAYPFQTSAELCRIDFSGNAWQQMLDELYRRKIHSIIVEGGTTLLNSLLNIGLWDEMHVETAPRLLHSGVEAPHISLLPDKEEFFDGHAIRYYYNNTTN